MRGELRLEYKHGERKNDKHQTGEVHGQHVHRKKSKDERNASEDAWRKQAWMGEFRVQAKRTYDQKNVEHVGLHDTRKKFFAAGHFVHHDRRMRKRKLRGRSVEAGNRTA